MPSYRVSPLAILITRFSHDLQLQTPVWPTALQETSAIRNKSEVLHSHVSSLDALFSEPPDTVGDRRPRNEPSSLARHTFTFKSLHAHLFPANLRTPRENCGRCANARGRSSLLMTFNTIKTYFDFSKICMRRPSSIRFVHELTFFPTLTKNTDGATNDD